MTLPVHSHNNKSSMAKADDSGNSFGSNLANIIMENEDTFIVVFSFAAVFIGVMCMICLFAKVVSKVNDIFILLIKRVENICVYF